MSGSMEKKILIVLAGILLLLVLSSITQDIVYEYNKNVDTVQQEKQLHADPDHYIGFSHDDPHYSPAGFNLIALPLFISLLAARRYFMSFFFTVLYFSFFGYSIWLHFGTCYLGEDICPPVPLFGRLSWWDITVILLLFILFLWQISIFLRGSSKRLQ
jgi:hypothetical protein